MTTSTSPQLLPTAVTSGRLGTRPLSSARCLITGRLAYGRGWVAKARAVRERTTQESGQ